jgi:hypothetical protein
MNHLSSRRDCHAFDGSDSPGRSLIDFSRTNPLWRDSAAKAPCLRSAEAVTMFRRLPGFHDVLARAIQASRT